MDNTPECKARETEELIVVDSVAAEYDYIHGHYDGYIPKQQWLSVDEKTQKSCDIMLIEKDGDKKYLYFDISGFFGK